MEDDDLVSTDVFVTTGNKTIVMSNTVCTLNYSSLLLVCFCIMILKAVFVHVHSCVVTGRPFFKLLKCTFLVIIK